jgi:cytidylate kinase
MKSEKKNLPLLLNKKWIKKDGGQTHTISIASSIAHTTNELVTHASQIDVFLHAFLKVCVTRLFLQQHQEYEQQTTSRREEEEKQRPQRNRIIIIIIITIVF